jgi:hypothetical protein
LPPAGGCSVIAGTVSHPQRGERAERQVANHEPRRYHGDRRRRRPAMVGPPQRSPAPQPSIGPDRIQGDRRYQRCQGQGVESHRCRQIAVQHRVEHPQGATAGTVQAEKRFGRAHRQQTTGRGRITDRCGRTDGHRRGGHQSRRAETLPSRCPNCLPTCRSCAHCLHDLICPEPCRLPPRRSVGQKTQ